MDLRALLILPVFGMMMLTLGIQLVDVASSASEKTIAFATDMDGAMDCAFYGLPLAECSPDIYGYDFTPEINQTRAVADDIFKEYSDILENNSIEYILTEVDNASMIIIYLN